MEHNEWFLLAADCGKLVIQDLKAEQAATTICELGSDIGQPSNTFNVDN